MSAQTHPLPVSAAPPQPSPQLFFHALWGFRDTAAIKAAIELDLFSVIAEGEQTQEAIALRCQASVRGVRILCDYLAVLGFLTKQDERYALTADTAAFLDRRSPQYIGSAVNFLTSPHLMRNFDDIAACVRKGGTVNDGLVTAEPDHPMWGEFARSMAPLMMLPAEAIARLLHADSAPRWKVLDIAAGHGMFGLTLARHNRNAEIHAVDWPSVLHVARENAEKFGVADRWHAQPGSAFDVEVGSGYDVALITNFCHHFDPPTNERLLRKVHAALAPHGRAVILEFVPDENRATPAEAVQFALTMLAGTEGGDAYTFAELERMCRNAGFRTCERHELTPTFSRALVALR